jgi:hypothetical protein
MENLGFGIDVGGGSLDSVCGQEKTCGERDSLKAYQRHPPRILSTQLTSAPQESPIQSLQTSAPISRSDSRMTNSDNADEYAMLRFVSNNGNRDLQETLNRSVVITDERRMGALYIQAHLTRVFPISGGFQWIARSIPNNRFLIDPPNEP